jgi:hypothetical protein
VALHKCQDGTTGQDFSVAASSFFTRSMQFSTLNDSTTTQLIGVLKHGNLSQKLSLLVIDFRVLSPTTTEEKIPNNGNRVVKKG